MTATERKPAGSAFKFLNKRWGVYVAECEKAYKLSLKLRAEDVARAVNTLFRNDLYTARRYWGSVEIDEALKTISQRLVRYNDLKGLTYQIEAVRRALEG